MTCLPTQTPPADELDIPAMREKDRHERDKRIRREGQAQYVRPTGEGVEDYITDPHMPLIQRAPSSEDIDVAILGAGWSGIMAASKTGLPFIGNTNSPRIYSCAAYTGHGFSWAHGSAELLSKIIAGEDVPAVARFFNPKTVF